MTVFRATFGLTDNQHVSIKPGPGNPVFRGRGANGLDELTTSGASQIVQDGGGDWTAPQTGYVRMKADGEVWVKIAAAPTAAAEADWDMLASERLELAVEEGDKIAVINA